MGPESRRRSKVHGIRIRRNIVIGKQRSGTKLKKRRKPPSPRKIPLQPKRIESHPISRIRRLKNQISRLRIHRILKPSPQKSRQMLPRKNPPITQPQIKNPGLRSPSWHRMPAPSPNLHLMPAFLRPNIRLRKAQPHCHDRKKDDRKRRDQVRRTRPAHSSHALGGCPTPPNFASPIPKGFQYA